MLCDVMCCVVVLWCCAVQCHLRDMKYDAIRLASLDFYSQPLIDGSGANISIESVTVDGTLQGGALVMAVPSRPIGNMRDVFNENAAKFNL